MYLYFNLGKDNEPHHVFSIARDKKSKSLENANLCFQSLQKRCDEIYLKKDIHHSIFAKHYTNRTIKLFRNKTSTCHLQPQNKTGTGYQI